MTWVLLILLLQYLSFFLSFFLSSFLSFCLSLLFIDILIDLLINCLLVLDRLIDLSWRYCYHYYYYYYYYYMCDPVRTLKSQSKKLVQITFRLINTLGIFSVILYKGDKFCDFLFAFLRIISFLKSGQVLKEGTLSQTFFFITKTCLFKYIENFSTKKGKFSDKKFWYFLYFCSKHRLWVSLEPPRRGGSNEYHNLCFWAEIRKIMFTPVNPSFTI